MLTIFFALQFHYPLSKSVLTLTRTKKGFFPDYKLVFINNQTTCCLPTPPPVSLSFKKNQPNFHAVTVGITDKTKTICISWYTEIIHTEKRKVTKY